MPYQVLIDDGYDYMDESKRYTLDEFQTYKAAVSAAEEVVDGFLFAAYRPGMTFDDLYGGYRGWGEDPFIRATPPDVSVEPFFSARGYAQKRCRELCESSASLGNESVSVTPKGRAWWQFWRFNGDA